MTLAQLGEAGVRQESSAAEGEREETGEEQADNPPQKAGTNVVVSKATSAVKVGRPNMGTFVFVRRARLCGPRALIWHY